MNKRKKKKKKISIALLLFLVFPSSPFFLKLSACTSRHFCKKRERERDEYFEFSNNPNTNKCGTSSSFELRSRRACSNPIRGRTRCCPESAANRMRPTGWKTYGNEGEFGYIFLNAKNQGSKFSIFAQIYIRMSMTFPN